MSLCGKKTRCAAMQMAIDGANPRDQTGVVVGILPPHLVAIRCKGERRGSYKSLILRLCPWCGEELPQGS